MTALDDLTRVVELACLTADRDDQEQDAMLRVAAKADTALNKLAVTNRRTGGASRLYRMVAESRDGNPRVNAKTATKLELQARRWEQER